MPPIQARSRWSLVVAMLAISLLATPAAGQLAPLDQGVVTLAEARSGHTATLLPGDYVLIAGGTGDQAELASVELVDPIAGLVEPLGDLAAARTGHTATLLPGDYVLVTGGRRGETAIADAEIYDPLAGSSEPIGPMKSARTGHDAVLLPDGRVLLIGGTAGGKPVARAEIYDPATRTFSKTAKSKAVHRDPAAAMLADGRVLVTGTATKKKGKPAEVYDPAKDKWVVIKKAGGSRSGHSATVLPDGRVLLTGGTKGGVPIDSAELFDPQRNAFGPGGDPVFAGADHTAMVMPSGSVLVLGGRGAASIESHDPATSTSEVVGNLGIERAGLTATLLDDGRVLIAGGRFITEALDDLLVFDPASAVVSPLGPTGLLVAGAESPLDVRTRNDIRTTHGPPDAFTIYYFDDVADDGSVVASSLEQWSYYGTGLEYTFEGDRVLAEEPVVLDGVEAEPVPYDPDQFSAYMDLDEVVAAAGLEDYLGGPADDVIDGAEIYFGDRLMWGMKDGELRFVEALALEAAEATEEAG